MQEHFHQTASIPRSRMKDLMQRNNSKALVGFITLYTLFIASSVWLVYSWHFSWLMTTFASALFGIICCSMFAAEHETVHNTAFKSSTLNKVVAFLAGIAHLYPSTLFRELHFTHHRYTHIPGKDPEISIGHKPVPSVIYKLPTYLAWITGVPLLLFKVGMIIAGAFGMPEFLRKNLYPFVRKEVRLKLFIESIIIVAIYSFIVYLALTYNQGFWGIFIGQAVGHCFLAGYTVLEHNGLPHEGNILQKTRSINGSVLLKKLMWNMPYHAEHHAYPAVPFHALPNLHQELQDELIHTKDSHPSFHWGVFSGFFKRKK